MGVGVVTAQVAAELLETGDLPRCRPADQGHALEHLPAAVVHPVGEGPLHHRLVPLVRGEKVPDAGVPLGEPHVEPLADGRFPLFHLIAPFRCICSYL
ncbi:Uncharacterised protein [uncultured Blautia sp.]|nr:Uncharacterised protein [uncultured Blautia sp.]